MTSPTGHDGQKDVAKNVAKNAEKDVAKNEKRPRHSIRAHLAMLDIGGGCYCPGCPACWWYRARGGWSADDSMSEYLNGMR